MICPNQVRSHGFALEDDPYDKNRRIGIGDPESEYDTPMHFIPFQMVGSIAGTTTRCPSMEEFQNCRKKWRLTSDARWDPNNMELPHHRATARVRAEKSLHSN